MNCCLSSAGMWTVPIMCAVAPAPDSDHQSPHAFHRGMLPERAQGGALAQRFATPPLSSAAQQFISHYCFLPPGPGTNVSSSIGRRALLTSLLPTPCFLPPGPGTFVSSSVGRRALLTTSYSLLPTARPRYECVLERVEALLQLLNSSRSCSPSP